MKKKLSVIGLGFVGLPIACILANSKNKYLNHNFDVTGIDQNLMHINKLKNFKKFKNEILNEDKNLNIIYKKALENNKLKLTNNISEISNSDIIIICINFDFNNQTKKKVLSKLKIFFSNLSKNVKKNALVMIETTLPPGTCDNVILPTLKTQLKKRQIKLSSINFSYSFERVMPGKDYLRSITQNFKCFAGMNNSSAKITKNFLKQYINTKKYPLFEFNKIIDCEAAKILENSYRAINIAFIDEWTKYSMKTNINLNEIIDAIQLRPTHKNIMRPGLGVGGYCLTKDPNFLNHSSKFFFQNKLKFPITKISTLINKNMPNTSIKFLVDQTGSIKNKKILILGASYKDNISDTRNSASIFLAKYFKKKKIRFSVHDPLIKISDNNKINIKKKLPNIKKFDLALFCVKHNYYNNLKMKKLPKSVRYFDLNRVLNKKQINFLKNNDYKIKVLGG